MNRMGMLPQPAHGTAALQEFVEELVYVIFCILPSSHNVHLSFPAFEALQGHRRLLVLSDLQYSLSENRGLRRRFAENYPIGRQTLALCGM